jgi:rhamnogalacturonan endolyase
MLDVLNSMLTARLNPWFLKFAIIAAAIFMATNPRAAGKSVTVTEDDSSFTLDNGIVAARVAKQSGDLVSLKYRGLEMLDTAAQRQPAYWSHNTSRGRQITRITIDPKANHGERGEVSIKGITGGNPRGGGPGGNVAADVEIRYALGRGDSGVYTYSIFSHPTNYPATSVGEARFCAKLNDCLFDWMTMDTNRNMEMITAYDWNHGMEMNMKEARRMNTGIYQGQVEHKYDYSANQFDVRAWGWISSAQHIGLWFVNPSVEYLSGGPTKFELSAHRDATFTDSLDAPAPPTLLNYWRSSHYGGALCNIAATDAWTKVIGPFMIYCNSGANRNALWQDALHQAKREAKAWPYNWVSGVDYPHKNQRGVATGRIIVHDPQAPGLVVSNLLVGLTTPDYFPPTVPRGRGGFGGFGPGGGGEDDTNNIGSFPGSFGRGTNEGFEGDFANRFGRFGTNSNGSFTNGFGGSGTNRFRGWGGRFGRGGFGGPGFFQGPRMVDWQNDAKYYEFWVRGDAKGRFTIPNIRPGNYTLHAIADGVLGDFSLSNVTVTADQTLDLGKLNWQPIRYGRQLWDIGIPSRNASEFFKGNDYYHWGWYLNYARLFPNDINYVIGQSDFHKDWFFEQVPHNEDPQNDNGRGRGRATTWTVTFDLPDAPRGRAILRLAICGVGTRNLAASVNGQSIGSVTNLIYNATIDRDSIGGYWCERDVAYDASLMKAGENTLALTVPAGTLTSGIMYDYLRLELDEQAPANK